MKITKVSKYMTYHITTDDPEFPEYRTDECGSEWENYLGGVWQPIFGHQTRKLQEMFREYKDQMNEVEE